MTIFLDRSPFFEQPDELIVRGERIPIRAHQIIVWVSVTLQGLIEPNPAAIPFPAILDTGHTHSFSILERHLVDWAGIRPEMLRILGGLRDRERGQRVLRREANLWMHANERSERDRLVDRPPARVKTKEGIAVYSEGDFPRLPLLGLRSIAVNELILKVDGKRRQAMLRTPFKWWPF